MSLVKFRFCELEKERGYSSACISVTGCAAPIFTTLFFARSLERAAPGASRDRTNAIFRLPRETERNQGLLPALRYNRRGLHDYERQKKWRQLKSDNEKRTFKRTLYRRKINARNEQRTRRVST